MQSFAKLYAKICLYLDFSHVTIVKICHSNDVSLGLWNSWNSTFPIVLSLFKLLIRLWNRSGTLFFVCLFYLFIFLNFILFFNFTILYWFCHISKWIHHRYTHVPHPEPFSFLPLHTNINEKKYIWLGKKPLLIFNLDIWFNGKNITLSRETNLC